ncbi:MAG TPA: hypothetical protein VFN10_17810 [Thermoanaerobaculia bacterium]|jgi:hypothetical protein|nr:hypothetical protein [Thermoanaerobaculia bacterium]
MDSLSIITIVGLLVLAGLTVVFLKMRRSDYLGEVMKKRQPGAKLVTRAYYVEGRETMPVALTLTDTAILYENSDLEASFDLDRIDEVEYSGELATGRTVPKGCRVMRLRVHGSMFEFELEQPECAKWMAALPPHRLDDAPQAHAV